MVAGLLENPTELAVDDGTYAGFAKIARELSLTQPRGGKPFSRQLVHKWYLKRETNGFPEALPVLTSTGKVKSMFVLSDVEAWHRTFRETHRPRPSAPKIDTIPLFEITSDGKTIW